MEIPKLLVGSVIVIFLAACGGGGSSSGEATEQQAYTAPEAVLNRNLEIADINGDGHLDFIAKAFDFGTDPNGGAFFEWLYINDGSGNFIEADPEGFPRFSPSFAVLDVDGDGLNDFVFENGEAIELHRRIQGPQ